MRKLFKTLFAIVIIFAVIIASAIVIVGIRMTGQVKAFDKSEIDSSQFFDLPIFILYLLSSDIKCIYLILSLSIFMDSRMINSSNFGL